MSSSLDACGISFWDNLFFLWQNLFSFVVIFERLAELEVKKMPTYEINWWIVILW